jgi:hypothetical protein
VCERVLKRGSGVCVSKRGTEGERRKERRTERRKVRRKERKREVETHTRQVRKN